MTLLFGITVLFGANAAGAQVPDATIGGTVTQAEQPVADVAIDLFTADQDGTRLEWLRSTTTGSDGSYTFTVTAGCYTVTFIAPPGQQYTNGSQWQNSSVCTTSGQTVSEIDAALSGGDLGLVTGRVMSRFQSVNGIQVDLFEARADGSRGSYLRSTVTGAIAGNGRFQFQVPTGCYVVTLIAGAGGTWDDSGSSWLNRSVCFTDVRIVDLGTIQISTTGGTSKIIRVSVTSDDAYVAGVGVDIFAANADGSRGRFLDSFTTADAPTGYTLGPISGCRVLTLIAPENRTFVESGTQWLNRSFCVVNGQDIYSVAAALTPLGVTCAAGAEFEPVFRDDFNGSELGDQWSVYNSAGNAGFGLRRPSAISIEDSKLVITADMVDGTLVSGGMSLAQDQTYGKYRFMVRTDNDPSQAVSGEVLTWPSSGVHPRDGENNIYSTLVQTPERNPFFSFIQQPFGSVADQVSFRHDADGSQFQIMTMEWTPDRISITREGPGGAQPTETFVLQETAEDLIPDVDHGLNIQLDAWKQSIEGPVRMEVDWVEVHRYCGQ